jgi:hypothetical protein
MGGEMLARAIVDSDPAWQMFSPFALVWAGGAFGRAAQQVSDWAHDARETLVGALARTPRRQTPRVAAAKARESAAKAATEAAPRRRLRWCRRAACGCRTRCRAGR